MRYFLFIMLVAVGLGLGRLFAHYTLAHTVMKWLCASYLILLAWRIATSGTVSAQTRDDAAIVGKPMELIGAALFQWVNPKAWAMATSTFGAYVPANVDNNMVAGLSGLFVAVAVPCVMSWALFGTELRRWLKQPRHARAFNITMAIVLIASLIPILRAY